MTDFEWAIARLKNLQQICEKNAGMRGAKLLKGHGDPDQIMTDAMDAFALRIVLAALGAPMTDTLRALVEKVEGWRRNQWTNPAIAYEVMCDLLAALSAVPPAPEKQVTRLEVIDEHGREYTRWQCGIEFSYQDDGRTLKVFVKGRR